MYIPIISDVIGLGKTWIQGKQEQSKIKLEEKKEINILNHKAKVATANAKYELAKSGQTQSYDLDKIAMQNMEKSWKDELILVIFMIPLIMAFIPDLAPYVDSGFMAISKMPDWYKYIIVGMIVVIYGMRNLLKMVLQMMLGKIKG